MRTRQNPTDEERKVASARAKAFYCDVLQHQLTDADKGRYVAIDGNTLEWEIDDTDACCDRLRERVPDATIYLLRHIYIAVEYFGCLSPEAKEAIEEEERRMREAGIGFPPPEVLAENRDRFWR